MVHTMSKGLRKWTVLLGFQVGIPLLVATMAFANSPKYPPAATVWGGRQYTDFYFVHFNTHLALPHLRNPENRALFERLVGRNNIERILTASGSRRDKQRELAMILSAMGGIRASYNLAVIIGEPLQEELTRVQVFHLYLIGAVADLADEDIAEKNCASAMKTAWLGVVQSLSEANVYSPTQITQLSDAAARRYPILSPLFPASERAHLREQIAALQHQQAEPESQRALARLLATVSGE
ncbi:MAG TPA: hypothetical protein VMZ01_07170 [Aestuariivirga sp.]|nr:hypothetical protein [Aestuariivirga sp.]